MGRVKPHIIEEGVYVTGDSVLKEVETKASARLVASRSMLSIKCMQQESHRKDGKSNQAHTLVPFLLVHMGTNYIVRHTLECIKTDCVILGKKMKALSFHQFFLLKALA